MRSFTLVCSLLWVLPAICLAQSALAPVQRESFAVESVESGVTEAETIEYWGLTADEWQRQQTLRKRYQGLLSAQLTPLEILGIVTDDPAERIRYAGLHAKRQHAILRRIRRYEDEFLAAMRELTQTADAKNLRVVVEVGCLEGSCASLLKRTLSRVEQGENLHIFVRGASTDDQIRLWATHHSIPIDRVRSGQITLNYAGPSMKTGLLEQ